MFNKYVEDDIEEAIKFVNRWGTKITGKKGAGTRKVYNGVSIASTWKLRLGDVFDDIDGGTNSSLVYGYYGRSKQSGGVDPGGHAVAYSKGMFFDPNHGLYSCDPPDEAGDDIDVFVKQNYINAFSLDRYAVFVLQHIPDSGGEIKTGFKPI